MGVTGKIKVQEEQRAERGSFLETYYQFKVVVHDQLAIGGNTYKLVSDNLKTGSG